MDCGWQNNGPLRISSSLSQELRICYVKWEIKTEDRIKVTKSVDL